MGILLIMTSSPKKRILVIAGLITKDDRVLITKRKQSQAFPNQWEFPGGKMESGESPQVTLRRELKEEIAVEVDVGEVWDVLFHAYSDFDLLMLVYHCQIRGDKKPQSVDVADWAWVKAHEIDIYDFLKADLPLVQRLQRQGVPTKFIAFES